jgi:hypothetical protein
MQVVGFVLFACLLVFWRLFFELKIHAHKTHKKGALYFLPIPLLKRRFREGQRRSKSKSLSFPTMLSLPNMPGMTTTGCSNGGGGGAKQHQVRL